MEIASLDILRLLSSGKSACVYGPSVRGLPWCVVTEWGEALRIIDEKMVWVGLKVRLKKL